MQLLGVSAKDTFDFKKAIQSSSAPSIIQPEEADRLIDFIVDESKLWGMARVERMTTSEKWVRFIDIRKGLLRPDECGDYVDTGNMSATGFKLTARKMKAVIPICDDMLADNLTGEALENQILRMVGDQLGNELEIMAIMANTDHSYNHPDVDTSVFHAFDGWYKQLRAGHVITPTFPNCCLDICHFGQMMRQLPTKFRRDKKKLRYFMADDVFQDWADILQKRGTALGDKVITGEAPARWMTTPIEDVPLLPTDLPNSCSAYENGEAGTFMFLTDPKNLVLGIQYDIEYERQRDGVNSRTFHIFRIAFDAGIINTDATVLLDHLTTRDECCVETSTY
jgi:hypothetical protein